MNLLNGTGDIILVLGFHMGIAGIALVTRTGAAAIILGLAINQKNPLYISKTLRHKFDWAMIKHICGIDIPYGFENGMFFLGRLLILSLVTK